jgi:hypothetical protein
MPLWLILALGAGMVWYLTKSPGTSLLQAGGTSAVNFYVGQIANVNPGTPMFKDAALTQDAGSFSGGTVTIKEVHTEYNSLGIVGPSGTGQGGGVPFYVSGNSAQSLTG